MKWFMPMLLLLGVLTACESTGHRVSTTSEDIGSTTIIPPVVKDEEVLDSVDEEPEKSVSIAEAVQSPEAMPQEPIEPLLQERSPEIVKAPPAPPSSNKKQSLLPIPQVPEPVNPRTAVPSEPVKPKTLQDIYFDFDEATILSSAEAILEANATLLRTRYKTRNILIEGHCDERGSVEYNLVLGVRRAQAAQAYLRDLGISRSRIRIVSYGKERPVCTQQHDRCWQKNRRAHFVLQ